MTEPYRPIACGIHDRLEDLAVRRVRCAIEYADGDVIRETSGVIVDVFARDAAEFLRLDSGAELRLDRIRRVRPGDGADRFPDLDGPVS